MISTICTDSENIFGTGQQSLRYWKLVNKMRYYHCNSWTSAEDVMKQLSIHEWLLPRDNGYIINHIFCCCYGFKRPFLKHQTGLIHKCWCTIVTLFRRLLRLICLRCFSKLLFVFLVLSSHMYLQCWWTAANSKWINIEYVGWRGILSLSVRIAWNHSKKKRLLPKLYSFSNRSLQYWQFLTCFLICWRSSE